MILTASNREAARDITLAPLVAALLVATLAGCAGKPAGTAGGTLPRTGIPSHSWPGTDGPPDAAAVDLAAIPDATPRVEPLAARGNPPFYQVDGQRYFVMQSANGHVERGIASWYGTKFHGRMTSSGEAYDMFAMTAAHRTLPLPTYAEVRNLENGKSVVVRINDRGPFAHNRVIDLSYAAAARLDIIGTGTGLVEVRVIDPSAPAVTTAATTPAAPDGADPRLFVQVGAFASRPNAERVADRLRDARIYNVELSAVPDTEPPLWRVRVGPLPGVDELDAATVRIAESGFPEARVVID